VYQDVQTLPGERTRWSVRFRRGADAGRVQVRFGSPGKAGVAMTPTALAPDGGAARGSSAGWFTAQGSYTVPKGQHTTRMTVAAVPRSAKSDGSSESRVGRAGKASGAVPAPQQVLIDNPGLGTTSCPADDKAGHDAKHPVAGSTAHADRAAPARSLPKAPRVLGEKRRGGQWRTPGSPGVPGAPTQVYDEDFENVAAGSDPIKVDSYTGAAPTNETYTADPNWLTGCNGWVLNYADTAGYAPGESDCGNTAKWWDGLRGLTKARGTYEGQASPEENHAIAAFTFGTPGANLTET
jgi:hypothetical protein